MCTCSPRFTHLQAPLLAPPACPFLCEASGALSAPGSESPVACCCSLLRQSERERSTQQGRGRSRTGDGLVRRLVAPNVDGDATVVSSGVFFSFCVRLFQLHSSPFFRVQLSTPVTSQTCIFTPPHSLITAAECVPSPSWVCLRSSARSSAKRKRCGCSCCTSAGTTQEWERAASQAALYAWFQFGAEHSPRSSCFCRCFLVSALRACSLVSVVPVGAAVWTMPANPPFSTNSTAKISVLWRPRSVLTSKRSNTVRRRTQQQCCACFGEGPHDQRTGADG
jgi:hypothetical protein